MRWKKSTLQRWFNTVTTKHGRLRGIYLSLGLLYLIFIQYYVNRRKFGPAFFVPPALPVTDI